MRLRCWFAGCATSAEVMCACARCGADVYSYEYRQLGCYLVEVLRSIQFWYMKNAHWVHHKCEGGCGKRMFFVENSCCSEECYSNWIPF